jgi:branched-chain amino acid transport system substrate-binding protein
VQLAALNAGDGGPPAVVSPSNTYVGLTRGGPGAAADEPDRFYPTGTRNYARTVAADDLQAAAHALLAHELGAERMFVVHSGQGYGLSLLHYLRRAAGRLDLRIAGVARWDPEAAGYGALARRVAGARPEAVLLAGGVWENGTRLLRDLRAALPERVALIAPDAFLSADIELAREPAAAGLYITVAGLPPERWSPGARAIAGPAEAGATAYALAAGQATELLLDAIARSDGTRAGVVNALMSGRPVATVAGELTLDTEGDLARAPITVLRIDPRAGARRTGDLRLAGHVFDRVLTPARDLVR